MEPENTADDVDEVVNGREIVEESPSVLEGIVGDSLIIGAELLWSTVNIWSFAT